MKSIGMVGSQLIHTYAYAMHLNEFDLEYARQAKTAPAWQVKMMEDFPDVEPLGGAQLTHVWGGLEGVPEDMAGTFGLTRSGSLDEVLEACDLIMVMDEQLEPRADLVKKALAAGRPVFADKVLSDSLATTTEIVDLAKRKDVMVAAWSQLGYSPELDAIREMNQGGTALATFAMKPEILRMYGIHLISTVQGAFPGKFTSCRLLVDDEQKLAFVENEHGTRIVMGAGTLFPGGMARIDYSVGGKAVLAETRDRVGGFRNAARDIVAMLDGKPPRFTPEDLLDATRLLETICGGAVA